MSSLKKRKRVIIACQNQQIVAFLELKGDLGNNLVPSPGFTPKENGTPKAVLIYP